MLDVARSEALAGQQPRRARLPSTASELLLIANANASGLHGSREIVDRAVSLLRSFGAAVETRGRVPAQAGDEASPRVRARTSVQRSH